MTQSLFVQRACQTVFAGLACCLCLQAAAVQASVEPADTALSPVEISAHAINRDQKPYHDLARVLDIFDREHAKLAPNASLRFTLYPWRDTTSMQDLKLVLRGNSVHKPIALASDGSFVLERDAAALGDDAQVVSNRQSRSLAWRADIRTPGLPPNTRRLGDLRLECKADLEGAGAGLATGIKTPSFWAIAAVTDPCMVRGVAYVWIAEQALFGITLVSGERRQALSSDFILVTFARGGIFAFMDWQEHLHDRAYTLPLWDTSWPDDTLVQLEYVDDQTSTSAKVQP